MFDQLLGNYLVKTKRITKAQFDDVVSVQRSVRVKLGLIAVAEKLMTVAQADEVNRLQAVMDKRFGDIAVEKGYLTAEQVSFMLDKQGNFYLTFVQTMIDRKVMTWEEIENSLAAYLRDMNFTEAQRDILTNGNIDDIIELFLPTGDEHHTQVCGIAIRTLFRLIDSAAYVAKSYWTEEFVADNLAIQEMGGDLQVTIGFAGREDSLLAIAGPYAKEEFAQVDLDALDAVGEILNCINGMFSATLHQEGLEVDMLPPAFFAEKVRITGDKFVVFPIMIKNKPIDFMVAIDAELAIMKGENA